MLAAKISKIEEQLGLVTKRLDALFPIGTQKEKGRQTVRS